MNWIAIRDWLTFVAEWLIVGILILEYFYDRNKDISKKQKKTRTTKKTTTSRDGIQTVEENIEVSEPIQEEKK